MPNRRSRRDGDAGDPTQLVVTDGPNVGIAVVLGGAADPDRTRRGRDDPPRRRLRVDPARSFRAAGAGVVRRGPRLDQRDVHRLAATQLADPGERRHAGPHRQDRRRAAEVGRRDLVHARRRDLRRRARAQEQRGLRVRRRAPGDDRRRCRWCALREISASTVAVETIRRIDVASRVATCSRSSPARSIGPTTGSASWSTRTPRSRGWGPR